MPPDRSVQAVDAVFRHLGLDPEAFDLRFGCRCAWSGEGAIVETPFGVFVVEQVGGEYTVTGDDLGSPS